MDNTGKKKEMRILHITTEYPPIITGGQASAVGGLINACMKAGMVVMVVHIRDMRRKEYRQPSSLKLVNSNQYAIIKPIVLNVFNICEAINVCINVIRKWMPHVIHLHTFCLLPLALAIKEQIGTPMVYTAHTLEREEVYTHMGPLEYLMRSAIQEELITLVDRIIVLCKTEMDLLLQYYPRVSDRIRIVGNGIDCSPSTYHIKAKKSMRTSNVVQYVGRFVERKGIQDLLAAIPYVLDKARATRFVLIGGQTIYDNCKDIEKRWLSNDLLKYRDQITFTGWIDAHELEEWYDAADILVVPSRYEPFGMVSLEGMRRGLPIVAAAVGGPMEVLEHGRTGLLFPSMDRVALSYYLLLLLKNPWLRQQIGVSAMEEVSNKWEWLRIAKKVQTVYHEIIN
jgi:glycogen synthase